MREVLVKSSALLAVFLLYYVLGLPWYWYPLGGGFMLLVWVFLPALSDWHFRRSVRRELRRYGMSDDDISAAFARLERERAAAEAIKREADDEF